MPKYTQPQPAAAFSIFFLLFLLSTGIIPRATHADVIMPNTHHVKRCVKITNTSQFPDATLIGYITGPMIIGAQTYKISPDECLAIGYKFNQLNIYATSTSYFNNQGIENLDLNNQALPANLSIAVGNYYITDNNPLSEENITYKIAGFTDNEVILYKSRHHKRFNDGSPDQTETFDQPDIPNLKNTFPQSPPKTSPTPNTVAPTPNLLVVTTSLQPIPTTTPTPTKTATTTTSDNPSSNDPDNPTPSSVSKTPPANPQASHSPTIAGITTSTPNTSPLKNQNSYTTSSLLLSPTPNSETPLNPEPLLSNPSAPPQLSIATRSSWQTFTCYLKSLFGLSCNL
jgi:hypothetical protein